MVISKLDYMAKRTYIRENIQVLINLIKKDFPNSIIKNNGDYSLSIESSSNIVDCNTIISEAIKTMVVCNEEESKLLFNSSKITDNHIIINL